MQDEMKTLYSMFKLEMKHYFEITTKMEFQVARMTVYLTLYF